MVITNPADQFFIREQNSSFVLWMLHKNAPLSRAQLAIKTGLNKSTVSSLVDELLERKLIHETGLNSRGVGRPGTLLEINPRAGCILGLEFGVDFLAVILTDFVGNILWRKEKATDPEESQKKTLERALVLVRGATAAARQINLPVLGMGLTIPGTVDLDAGTLIFAPNLHWHNLQLREFFSRETGLKVYLENDANAAAVAEHLFGTARQSTDFLFVFAGVGIGGGLFLNGELYRGKNGYAGEIGHSPINAEPLLRPCHCGNFGCWETYVKSGIHSRANEESPARKTGQHCFGAYEQATCGAFSFPDQAGRRCRRSAGAQFLCQGRICDGTWLCQPDQHFQSRKNHPWRIVEHCRSIPFACDQAGRSRALSSGNRSAGGNKSVVVRPGCRSDGSRCHCC